MPLCNALQRMQVVLLRSLGLRFPQPEMEAQFQDKESRYVVGFTNYWILLHILITAIVLLLRCYRFGWRISFVFYANFLPFGIVGLLFLTMHVSLLKPRTYQLLCLTNLLMMAWTAWMVHLVVELELSFMETSTLVEVYAAINGNPGARETLRAFTAREVSRKYLWWAIVMELLLLDLLQFLGLTWEAIVVFASLPLSLLIVSYASPMLSPNVLEPCVMCLIATLYTIFISYHVSRNRRRQFELDHQLHTSLESEAKALKEAAEQEAALKEASQEADTILNHMLKNVMADAAGCIYLYLQSLACALHSGATPPADLVLATECLERGVAWCRKRQALLRIASGKYTPQRGEVDLARFGHGLLQGRPIEADLPAVTAVLDPLLCEIILENALTNACRHCDPDQPGLRFGAYLTPLTDPDEVEDKWYCLTFVVMNRAHPARPPITPELGARLLQGEDLPLGPNPPRLSEHLGLQHLCQAARAHNATLKLAQTGDVVRFEAALEVTLRRDCPPQLGRQLTLSRLTVPPGLRVFCIDDSAVARRLLTHTLSREPFRAEVTTFGYSAEEVPLFLERAARQADIVVLDYHLDYGPVQFLGTDLLRDLLGRGYRGLAVIRSANASPYDEARYIEAGAHCCIGKDLHPQAMTDALMAVYLRRDHPAPTRRRPPPGWLEALPAVDPGDTPWELHLAPPLAPRHPRLAFSSRGTIADLPASFSTIELLARTLPPTERASATPPSRLSSG